MIVLSRPRIETDQDAEWAERLGVSVLSIPFLYDLRSFGPTVERLRLLSEHSDEPSVFVAPLPVRASANLLDAILKPRRAREVFTQLYDSVSTPLDEIVVPAGVGKGTVQRLDEPVARRWYPVVDVDRCTGCLECVNFCLFGVYVIGENDRPVVDQPDACRDGCPACSRVCPGWAIMFPMHEDATIAGYRDMPDDGAMATAEEERRRYTSSHSDVLDDLVDRIDRFTPS